MVALVYLAGWLLVRSTLDIPARARLDAYRSGVPQRHAWFIRVGHESFVLWLWWAIAIGGVVHVIRGGR